MPDFDPSLLEFRHTGNDLASKKDDPLVWNSQIVSEPSIEIGRDAPNRDQLIDFDDDDMNMDLGLDNTDGPSIEIARDAPPPLSMDDDLLEDPLMTKDFAIEEDRQSQASSQVPSLIQDRDEGGPDQGGMLLDNGDDFAFPQDDEPLALATHNKQLLRDSQSPLSSLPSDDLDRQDATHINEDEPEDSPARQAPQKAKKRKILPSDPVTMLTSDTIKKQQADRSAILKPLSFLPRDQMLLNLLNLQKKGGFVSSLINEGPIKGLAPELRGILSIEVVRKSSQLKRKRDDTPAEVADDDTPGDVSVVRFNIPEDESNASRLEEVGEIDDAPRDSDIIELPADDGFEPLQDERDDEDEDMARDQFDETTAPLLHPMEQGAISQGTKHAVHLLRDRFGASSEGSPSQQKKTSILFQDLLPERVTTKADATKMFFETLVLATKDAIKVEQGDKEVGANMRIRAKRGLWGAWAEKEAGGEIAGQDEQPEAVAAAS